MDALLCSSNSIIRLRPAITRVRIPWDPVVLCLVTQAPKKLQLLCLLWRAPKWRSHFYKQPLLWITTSFGHHQLIDPAKFLQDSLLHLQHLRNPFWRIHQLLEILQVTPASSKVWLQFSWLTWTLSLGSLRNHHCHHLQIDQSIPKLLSPKSITILQYLSANLTPKMCANCATTLLKSSSSLWNNELKI